MYSLLRRPAVLFVVLIGVAIAGGFVMRARERAVMAQMFPYSTPEAQQALQAAIDPTQSYQTPVAYQQSPQSDVPPVAPPSVAPNAFPNTAGMQIIGIPSEALDFTYSSQRNSMWCWAASIQMVLQYHGIRAEQQDIVARTFGPDAQGNLPNQPGSLRAITANLNNFNVDRAGTTYQVESIFGEGAPPVDLLLDEMDRREPIIIGYKASPDMGHAVVITGVVYSQTPQGNVIHKIIVRDPWPSSENRATNGRVEYEAGEFAPKIQGYWRIRVRQ
ncbi:MAG: C39 family peptidase [Gemmatimonadaceae bacterium]|nr:C39 family peptidase [Gemmatimonadaceae bacterium]